MAHPSAVAKSYDTVASAEAARDPEAERAAFRSINNYVKRTLTAAALGAAGVAAGGKGGSRPPLNVLDIACGRGGDVPKWLFANRTGRVPYGAGVVGHLLGYDISPVSIESAKNRFADVKAKSRFETGLMRFAVADCFDAAAFWPAVDADAAEALGEVPGVTGGAGGPLDVASVQFALHYGAGSEEVLAGLVGGVAARLRRGGVFVGTIVDSAELSRRVIAHRRGRSAEEAGVRNGLFHISVDWARQTPPVLQALAAMGLDDAAAAAAAGGEQQPDGAPEPAAADAAGECLPMGLSYRFELTGLVDADEFVIPLATLERIAAAHGLRRCAAPEVAAADVEAALLNAPLGEWETDWHSRGPRVKDLGPFGELEADDRQLVSLYRAFCFVKE